MPERSSKKSATSPEQFLAELELLCDGWVTEYVFMPPCHRMKYKRANSSLCVSCKAQDECEHHEWAFDYANSRLLIAIEIEGGLWMSTHGGKSRHFTGSGASSDMKKYNAAEVRGWTILRYPDNNRKLSQSTVQKAIRDVTAIITGISEGQRTLEQTMGEQQHLSLGKCEGKLLSEVLP